MNTKLSPITAAPGLTAAASSPLPAAAATATMPSQRTSAKRLKPIVNKSDDDYLMSPEDIEAEGGPSVSTQYIWKCTGRYGWDKLIIKVGHRNRIKRGRWREWLQER